MKLARKYNLLFFIKILETYTMNTKFLSFALCTALALLSLDAAGASFREFYDSTVKNYNAKKYDDALKDVARALTFAENDQEKLQALIYKLNTYNAQKRYLEAAAVSDEALKLKITEYQKNQCLYNQFVAYYNANKPDECLTACDQVIASKKIDFKDNAYYYKFATYMWKKNDKDKAIETANSFTTYSSTIKNFWYYKGLVYQMMALRDKKEYDKALSLVPAADAEKMPGASESEYYNLLGDIYKIQKKYKEAAEAYGKAAKADNGYHGGAGCYLLGDVYCTMNNDIDALAAFRQVLDLPDSSATHKTIAMVRAAELLNKADKPADAFGMIKKAEALPGADVNWVARGKILSGKILLQQNKKDDAKKVFEAVAATKGISADYVKQAQAEADKIK